MTRAVVDGAPAPADGPSGVLSGIVPRHASAGQLVVIARGGRAVDAVAGFETDDRATEIVPTTLFDLASLTKLFTATAFMRLVEGGATRLDDRAARILPEIGGRSQSAQEITWRHLLSHTAGLPSTVPLLDARSIVDARARVLAIEPARCPGEVVAYSDVGFILLGFAIERMSGAPLDSAIRQLVLLPLGLSHTTFRPDAAFIPVAATEVCPWRGRRLRGEVHDENAAVLGGVAGHAGLFGSAGDLATFGACFLEGGAPVLSGVTIQEMTREQARDGAARRGLGFSLWSPDPEATSHPFSVRTYGHTGFTGTSLWIDPDRSIVVALLTNAVYRGRAFDPFTGARIALHRALTDAIDAQSAPEAS